MLREYAKERGMARRRRPMDVVRLLAFLGSPASELAQVMGCDVARLHQAERGLQALTPSESSRLALWLSAAWWRHSWRCGNKDATTASAVQEAASYVALLPWVPDDYLRDLSVAASEISNDYR
jgi:transcriptional regulator with XRE-family HTH domain|tara:strand:- start:55 stop:423 length:369 start_codon:yes stop_codon:yes gene_type:complete